MSDDAWLGTGMAEKARQDIENRRNRIDRAVDDATATPSTKKDDKPKEKKGK